MVPWRLSMRATPAIIHHSIPQAGDAAASRLELGRLAVETGLRFTGAGVVPSFRLEVGEGLVRISMADADGFLATILGGIELESGFADHPAGFDQ